MLGFYVTETLHNDLTKVASLVQCLKVRFCMLWLWARVLLQSLNFQISRLFKGKSSLAFRQLQSVDLL